MTPALEIRLAQPHEAALVADVLTQPARRLREHVGHQGRFMRLREADFQCRCHAAVLPSCRAMNTLWGSSL